MSNWIYDIVDTITGVPQSRVFPMTGSWSRALNMSTSGTHVFPAAIPMVSRTSYKALTRVWERMLVVSRFSDAFGLHKKAIYAGVITGRSFDIDAAKLTVRHGCMRGTVLARRFTLGTNGYSGNLPINNNYPMNNLAKSSAISLLLKAAMEGPVGNYMLPIVRLPDDLPGSFSGIFWDYNFPGITKEIDGIQNGENGPDTDLVPVWASDGHLDLVQVGGTEAQPSIIGPAFDFNMSSAYPPLFGVSIDEDGRNQSNVVHSVGEGSGQDLKVGTARVATTAPALEQKIQFKTGPAGADIPTLEAHARAAVAVYKQSTIQWTASMLASTTPGIENIPLGSILRLWFRDHYWVDDGWTELRVIGISGTEGETIRFDVQPTGGA